MNNIATSPSVYHCFDCGLEFNYLNNLLVHRKACKVKKASEGFPWSHGRQCTERLCYCTDPNDPDPICECGNPGWACCCKWDELKPREIRVPPDRKRVVG